MMKRIGISLHEILSCTTYYQGGERVIARVDLPMLDAFCGMGESSDKLECLVKMFPDYSLSNYEKAEEELVRTINGIYSGRTHQG